MPEPLASGEVLRRFLDRIERDLAGEPLEMDPQEHRRRLAELLAVCGSGSHYEVLGVGRSAGEAEVHTAFRRIARSTHPLHAAALGMEEQLGVFQILFERATEAYLVLSDTRRRDGYDRLSAADAHWARNDEERGAEARRMAADLHEQARELIERDDYHFAVELLRQAVRLDPSAAESWALLGFAQKANPQWLHMASDSLRRAVQLEPESIDHRLALAEIETARGEHALAERVLRQVLDRHPDHPRAAALLEEAVEAREREAGGSKAPARRGMFRRKS